MTKRDQLYLAGKLRSEPEILDEDMSRSDLVDVLRRLKFETRCAIIWSRC
jgi:hypothetical protein